MELLLVADTTTVTAAGAANNTTTMATTLKPTPAFFLGTKSVKQPSSSFFCDVVDGDYSNDDGDGYSGNGVDRSRYIGRDSTCTNQCQKQSFYLMTMAVPVENLMMQKMMTRKNELGNMIQSNKTNLGTMAVTEM